MPVPHASQTKAVWVSLGWYPALQEHTPLPGPEPEEAGQSRHAASFVARAELENLPASQIEQKDAPRLSEYLPTSQSLQLAVPVVFLYSPASHSVQFSGPPEYPTLHSHRELPEMLFEFVGHCRQVLFPSTFLYFPSSHAVQAPSGPV